MTKKFAVPRSSWRSLVLPGLLAAQDDPEQIEIAGNDRVTPETILYYLTSREGEPYEPDTPHDATSGSSGRPGFFSNIKPSRSSRGRGARIVRIAVEENPVVRAVTYQDRQEGQGKGHRRQAQGEGPVPSCPTLTYSPHKIQRIKDTITDLLFEKGLLAVEDRGRGRQAGQERGRRPDSRSTRGPRSGSATSSSRAATKLPAGNLT
ncbi:MAG: hypothetical protein M0C28_00740 [Candidatus Moduliflexus flocculans]|nr:hypothetical protein [Candidatus Moduliflexus flocculans]